MCSSRCRNRLRQWLRLMPSPVRQSQFRAGVGVTVAAEMRAGVVSADVLADDAAARLALSLVFLRFWDVPAAEHVVFRSDEVHECGIIVEEPHHQLVIDALVVPDTIHAQIGLSAAGGVPILSASRLNVSMRSATGGTFGSSSSRT